MKYIKLYEQTTPEHRVRRRSDGSVEEESWHLSGKLHREDGPAWIQYRPDGSVLLVAWHLDGKFHREDGPARIHYRQDGSVELESWWLDDQWLKDVTSQEDFEAWKYLKSVGLV
jgi:hypothetical protein